jgi:hypothetical protein
MTTAAMVLPNEAPLTARVLMRAEVEPFGKKSN